MENDVKVVILAAGMGKRMGGERPKVLSPISKKPMILHLLHAIEGAGIQKPIAVIGYGSDIIKSELADQFTYVIQKEQLGTAHALFTAKEECRNAKKIAVFYGDHPFVSSETIKKLLEKSKATNAEITLASAEVENFENENKVFSHFGRVLRNDGKIIAIREYKDATDGEKNVKEVSPGYYVFDASWLWANLPKINNENAQGEYYLTDLLTLTLKNNQRIESIQIPPREAMGANSEEELEILEKLA